MVMRMVIALAVAGLLVAEDGAALQRAGRLPEAEAAYRAELNRDQGRGAAARGLATVVGWQGRHGEAEALWQAQVARDPADRDAWLGLARVRYWRGDLNGATAALDRALVGAPAGPEALALAGDVAAAAGDRERAATHYRIALAGDPAQSEALHGLSRISATAAPNRAWRADILGGYETWTAVYDTAFTVGIGLARRTEDAGTFAGQVRTRTFPDRTLTEQTGRLGWGRAFGSVSVELAGEFTRQRVIAPTTVFTVGAAWQATPWLAPLADVRLARYPDDSFGLIRPGLRITPLPGWDVEGRLQWSRTPTTAVERGSVLGTRYAFGDYAVVAGWALASEAEPPLAPARVETWSGGLQGAWGRCSLRADFEYEDRAETWRRRAYGLGIGYRW